jgi:hypothetical protein
MHGAKTSKLASRLLSAGVVLGAIAGCGNDKDDSRDTQHDVGDVVQCSSCYVPCYDDHLSDPLLNAHLQPALRLSEKLWHHAAILEQALDRVVAAQVTPELVHAYVSLTECSASREAAHAAYADCALDMCPDLSFEENDLDFVCSGTCDGPCHDAGSCSGTRTCPFEVEGEACDDSCEGVCVSDETRACPGHCFGECTGNCSTLETTGTCNGYCDGSCKGTCSLDQAGDCAGACFGTCSVESDVCFSERECQGQCDGNCEGECQGTFVVESDVCPSAFRCEDLSVIASALEITCSQPSVVVWNRETEPDADAPFPPVNVGAVQADFAAIARETALLQAFLEGKVNGEPVFEPTLAELVLSAPQAVVEDGVTGELLNDVPIDELSCVIPTLENALNSVNDAGSEASSALVRGLEFMRAYGLAN